MAPEEKRANGRTKVELGDGRTIIVADGDVIPAGGKPVGKEDVPTPEESAQLRTADVKSPKRQSPKRAPRKSK